MKVLYKGQYITWSEFMAIIKAKRGNQQGAA